MTIVLQTEKTNATSTEKVNVQELVRRAYKECGPDVNNKTISTWIKNNYPDAKVNLNSVGAACTRMHTEVFGRNRNLNKSSTNETVETVKPSMSIVVPSEDYDSDNDQQSHTKSSIVYLSELENCRDICGTENLINILEAVSQLTSNEVGMEFFKAYRKSLSLKKS